MSSLMSLIWRFQDHGLGPNAFAGNTLAGPCDSLTTDVIKRMESFQHRPLVKKDGRSNSHIMPKDLPTKVAALLKSDPYITREILERSEPSLHSRFLQLCLKGQAERCKEIWGALREQERHELAEACNSRGSARGAFFMKIAEPDADMRTEGHAHMLSCGASSVDDCLSCSGTTRASGPSLCELWDGAMLDVEPDLLNEGEAEVIPNEYSSDWFEYGMV